MDRIEPMKVFLLHRRQDLQLKPELRDAMFDAMSSGRPVGANQRAPRACPPED